MKRLLAFVLVGLIGASFTLDADAQRRLGGGRNLGKQSQPVQERQATPPAQQAPTQQTPAQQATPTQQPAPAAAARPSSPWKGALLGLAAGLGLAALASHFGFGETLTALLMAGLVGFAVLAVAGFVIRRMRGATPQPSYGGAGSFGTRGPAPQAPAPLSPAPMPRVGTDLSGARPGSAMDEFTRGTAADAQKPWGVPAGFDTDGFLVRAKDYFSRLQGAWDRGDLSALQEFTTQDMFVALTHELRARASDTRTEVLTLDATMLGIESSPKEHLASVRFAGSLRVDGDIEQVDEVWNLSKPADGSSGWLLAGIQQLS
jgi:predicted lipid-binding transport protein (Tim44 family)